MVKKTVLGFVLLSVLASAINYAAYPVLGRLLPAAQYVDVTVSLSLLTQMLTFLSSIIAITIGLSKSEEHGVAKTKIESLQALVFKLFLAITIVFLAVSPLVMSHINVPLQFVLPICLMLLVSIPLAVLSGFLTGKGLMIKLGLLTATSAFMQFVVAATTALVTNNGLLAMLSMAVAQIAAITIAYRLFHKEQLPKIGESIWKRTALDDRQYMRRLATYTFISSLAIMALNLVQIADLLIVQAAGNHDTKFYTDIYVISRVVFFAGMTFVWPFLSEVNIAYRHLNRRPVVRITALFTFISLGAIGALFLLGNRLTEILFGASYDLHRVQMVGLLSVLYKLSFLIITAVVLYFVVLRDYLAVWLAGGLAVCIGVYSLTVRGGASTESILITLNIMAGSFAVLSLVNLFVRKIKPKS